MTNAKFTRDEWTMKGELSLRGPSYSPTPFESRWVRAEWADAEIERLRALLKRAGREVQRLNSTDIDLIKDLFNYWVDSPSHEPEKQA